MNIKLYHFRLDQICRTWNQCGPKYLVDINIFGPIKGHLGFTINYNRKRVLPPPDCSLGFAFINPSRQSLRYLYSNTKPRRLLFSLIFSSSFLIFFSQDGSSCIREYNVFFLRYSTQYLTFMLLYILIDFLHKSSF